MNPSHKAQIEQSVLDSLTKAGIGRAYHRRRLGEVAPTQITDWVVDPRAAIADGMGWTIIGTDKAYDTTLLLARATHLKGSASLVVPLRRMLKWIEHDTDEVERLNNVPCLYVTNFFDVYTGATEPPLKPWQVQDVEALLSERLDNLLSVTVHATAALNTSWWTPTLMRRLNRVNTTVHIS